MSAPAIEVEGLTKFYGDVRGIEDVSFAVEPGEAFGFLGPNGAGKTTTINVLLGLLSPTDGTARLLGQEVTDRRALLDAKRRLGYVSADTTFYEQVTGERVLDYFARLKGDPRREELLERFPVPVDRNVGAYSRGNRQKLGIVQAFMHDPDVVLMDEPTSGLDPLFQREFYALLDEAATSGVTVFFSSHILGEVRRVCDRVGVVRDGRLVALEDVGSLLHDSGTVVRVRLAETPPVEALEFDGVVDADVDEAGFYRLILSGNFDALVDRLDEFEIEDLEVRETSLEDVFLHFYDGDDV